MGDTKTYYEGNFLNKHLLYDAVSTIDEALNSQNLDPKDLDSVYISHLHDDHSGGVEYLGFKTYFGQFPFGENKIKLFGHNRILQEGWGDCWRSGLRSIQGKTNTLETYFDTEYMSDNDNFYFYGTHIQPIQTVNVVDDRRIVPSYGIMINERGMKIFISGDSQFAPNQMLTYFEQADKIFNDCEFVEYLNSVHTQFHQLCTLPDNIKSKMSLYHYSLGESSYEDLEKQVLENGFAGLVKRGETFKF